MTDTPAGITPGSADLAPDPVADEAPQPAPGCPICGHAPEAHTAGRCLIMLGAYGTEGPCPCPDGPAAPTEDVPAETPAAEG